MKINLLTTFQNVDDYITSAKDNPSELSSLWTTHMIEPFWNDIAAYTPFDQSFKQPTHVQSIEQLEKQLPLLQALDIVDLTDKFISVIDALPSDDDDPMLVALYPLCDNNEVVKERQNGILGANIFGNMIININPLADDWQKWIPYVFAHEYHHNIWGHNWYVVRGGKDLEGTFLEHMITEGQADLFAMSLFPELTPQWNRPFDTEIEKELWEKVKSILYSTDHDTHAIYMFGSKEKSLPWCMGYVFGRIIVGDYLQKNPMPFKELLNISAKEIFEASRYGAI